MQKDFNYLGYLNLVKLLKTQIYLDILSEKFISTKA